MRTIVMNTNNVVKDGQNNKLVYNFPNSVKFDKTYLSVASVSMYYSWFNITSALNNNTFTFSWTVGVTTTPYTFTLPDGLYEVATINQYFQWYCIQNGWFLIAPSGQNVYFAEFVINESQYKVDINTFYVPTALPSGYTEPTTAAGYPANFAGYPTATTSPTITITVGLGAILGFTTTASQTIGGLAGGVAFASAVVAQSVSSPNLQPNSSVLISSSMIDNPYTSPTSIIYSITPSVAVGEIISEKPPSFMWNKLIDGVYNQLRITLLGTDLAPLKIQDGAITIILALADEDEVKTK